MQELPGGGGKVAKNMLDALNPVQKLPGGGRGSYGVASSAWRGASPMPARRRATPRIVSRSMSIRVVFHHFLVRWEEIALENRPSSMSSDTDHVHTGKACCCSLSAPSPATCCGTRGSFCVKYPLAGAFKPSRAWRSRRVVPSAGTIPAQLMSRVARRNCLRAADGWPPVAVQLFLTCPCQGPRLCPTSARPWSTKRAQDAQDRNLTKSTAHPTWIRQRVLPRALPQAPDDARVRRVEKAVHGDEAQRGRPPRIGRRSAPVRAARSRGARLAVFACRRHLRAAASSAWRCEISCRFSHLFSISPTATTEPGTFHLASRRRARATAPHLAVGCCFAFQRALMSVCQKLSQPRKIILMSDNEKLSLSLLQNGMSEVSGVKMSSYFAQKKILLCHCQMIMSSTRHFSDIFLQSKRNVPFYFTAPPLFLYEQIKQADGVLRVSTCPGTG